MSRWDVLFNLEENRDGCLDRLLAERNEMIRMGSGALSHFEQYDPHMRMIGGQRGLDDILALRNAIGWELGLNPATNGPALDSFLQSQSDRYRRQGNQPQQPQPQPTVQARHNSLEHVLALFGILQPGTGAQGGAPRQHLPGDDLLARFSTFMQSPETGYGELGTGLPSPVFPQLPGNLRFRS